MAARQFRSDDTSTWVEKYGSGADGALTISSNTTWAEDNESCSGTAAGTTLTIGSGNFANGDLILIHQTRGTGVGAWELNKVSSGGGTTTLTLAYALINTYTDSGASQAQVVHLRQYSSVTVDSTKTWTAPSWDQNKGGILAFLCNGTTTITGNIVASGGTGGTSTTTTAPGATVGGYAGGDGGTGNGTYKSGEGTVGASAAQTTANGNAGGGAGVSFSRTGGGGGGHSASGNVGLTSSGGTVGAAGGTSGVAGLTTMTFGGGGGGGGRDVTAHIEGGGGSGGGILLIISKVITVTGTLAVNGGAGGGGGDGAGGGGAAGGSILMKCQTATLGSTLVTALLGVKGTGESDSHGGDGAAGRIHLDYLTSFTGTTSPTLDSTQDATLTSPSGGFFAFL